MAKRAAQTSRGHLSLNAITETFNRYLTGRSFKIRQKNVAEPSLIVGIINIRSHQRLLKLTV